MLIQDQTPLAVYTWQEICHVMEGLEPYHKIEERESARGAEYPEDWLKCHFRMHAISCLGSVCKVQASMLLARDLFAYVWLSAALVLAWHQVNASDDNYPRDGYLSHTR